MENIIIVIILLAIAGGIIFYLYRTKKSGQKCIGCPYAKQCSSKNSQCNSYGCSCGCGGSNRIQADSETDSATDE